METNIKVGDTVEIVLYGEMKLDYDTQGGLVSKDIRPNLIGQKGVVDHIVMGRVTNKYFLKGIQHKYGPFFIDQLKKIV